RTGPIVTVAAIGCIALSAGCGGSQNKGLLSASQANSVNAALDRVDSAVAAGDCTETAAASDSLRQIVANLPDSVDPALRGSLIEGTAKVSSLGATDCEKVTTSTTTSHQPRLEVTVSCWNRQSLK
ncbi:MAG: hypothetical protein EBZ48_15840, partial [Proteobacteria bacterium]|nr:hypothetical protein [Pseudomonadota bacterium]